MAWICNSCGGEVVVEMSHRLTINKDKTVNVSGLIGNKNTIQKITCVNSCGYTTSMEKINNIGSWKN